MAKGILKYLFMGRWEIRLQRLHTLGESDQEAIRILLDRFLDLGAVRSDQRYQPIRPLRCDVLQKGARGASGNRR